MIEYSTSNPEEIISKFRCPVCLDVVYQPKMTLCKHIFCFKCLELWFKKSRRCPLCRETFDINRTINPPMAFQNEIGKLRVKCKFREKGCCEEMDRCCLEDHERFCEFRGLRCNISSCKRPLYYTNEDFLVKKKRFCCKSCLEKEVIQNYLLRVPIAKVWDTLRMKYSECTSFESEKRFFDRMIKQIARKSDTIHLLVTKQINKLCRVAETVEEKDSRRTLMRSRLLALIEMLIPDLTMFIDTKQSGEQTSFRIHYFPRFREEGYVVDVQF